MDKTPKKTLSNKIYMSIDHLKKGAYTLTILEKERIVKSIKIKKR